MARTQELFNIYSRYYDLLYQDKDYVGEATYIDSLLKKNKLSGNTLLEFGSGTGKHGRLLAELGYRVHGIEQSTEMISRTVTGNGFTCEVGDICAIDLNRNFDAVLSLFHVVSYQVSNKKAQAVFSRAAKHLKRGGLFLFDIWYSPAVYSLQPQVRVKHMMNEAVEITRIAEPNIYPNENRVDVNYTIFVRDLASGEHRTLKECHPMRHFSLPEIKILAQNSGFDLILAEEFLTGFIPNENTWSVCIVLQRIQS